RPSFWLTHSGKVQMVTLDLSASEQAVLRQVLETAVSDLGTEISGTDAKDFRDDLKARREVLYKVLAALGGTVPPAV
ncbi:MAG TPA: hypothetical protein VF142_07925, partial [Longimicrobium sp.]